MKTKNKDEDIQTEGVSLDTTLNDFEDRTNLNLQRIPNATLDHDSPLVQLYYAPDKAAWHVLSAMVHAETKDAIRGLPDRDIKWKVNGLSKPIKYLRQTEGQELRKALDHDAPEQLRIWEDDKFRNLVGDDLKEWDQGLDSDTIERIMSALNTVVSTGGHRYSLIESYVALQQHVWNGDDNQRWSAHPYRPKSHGSGKFLKRNAADIKHFWALEYHVVNMMAHVWAAEALTSYLTDNVVTSDWQEFCTEQVSYPIQPDTVAYKIAGRTTKMDPFPVGHIVFERLDFSVVDGTIKDFVVNQLQTDWIQLAMMKSDFHNINGGTARLFGLTKSIPARRKARSSGAKKIISVDTNRVGLELHYALEDLPINGNVRSLLAPQFAGAKRLLSFPELMEFISMVEDRLCWEHPMSRDKSIFIASGNVTLDEERKAKIGRTVKQVILGAKRVVRNGGKKAKPKKKTSDKKDKPEFTEFKGKTAEIRVYHTGRVQRRLRLSDDTFGMWEDYEFGYTKTYSERNMLPIMYRDPVATSSTHLNFVQDLAGSSSDTFESVSILDVVLKAARNLKRFEQSHNYILEGLEMIIDIDSVQSAVTADKDGNITWFKRSVIPPSAMLRRVTFSPDTRDPKGKEFTTHEPADESGKERDHWMLMPYVKMQEHRQPDSSWHNPKTKAAEDVNLLDEKLNDPRLENFVGCRLSVTFGSDDVQINYISGLLDALLPPSIQRKVEGAILKVLRTRPTETVTSTTRQSIRSHIDHDSRVISKQTVTVRNSTEKFTPVSHYMRITTPSPKLAKFNFAAPRALIYELNDVRKDWFEIPATDKPKVNS